MALKNFPSLKSVKLALRIDGDDLDSQLTRNIAAAGALAHQQAPHAPESVADEAVVRMVGWLWEGPTAPGEVSEAGAWRRCGAEGLLAPWTVRRAGAIGGTEEEAEPMPTLDEIRAIIDEALDPIQARLRTLEEAGGVTPRVYVGYTGWSADETIDAADFAAGVTFRDGSVGTPAGGPGYFWFAVPVAEGYPDRIIILGSNQTGGFAEQAPVIYQGAGYIVGRSNAALGSFFPGDPPTRLEYD